MFSEYRDVLLLHKFDFDADMVIDFLESINELGTSADRKFYNGKLPDPQGAYSMKSPLLTNGKQFLMFFVVLFFE